MEWHSRIFGIWACVYAGYRYEIWPEGRRVRLNIYNGAGVRTFTGLFWSIESAQRTAGYLA